MTEKTFKDIILEFKKDIEYIHGCIECKIIEMGENQKRFSLYIKNIALPEEDHYEVIFQEYYSYYRAEVLKKTLTGNSIESTIIDSVSTEDRIECETLNEIKAYLYNILVNKLNIPKHIIKMDNLVVSNVLSIPTVIDGIEGRTTNILRYIKNSINPNIDNYNDIKNKIIKYNNKLLINEFLIFDPYSNRNNNKPIKTFLNMRDIKVIIYKENNSDIYDIEFVELKV